MKRIIITQLLMASAMATYAQKQQNMEVKSKLGTACTLNYGVTDMNKAISFYEQLNYKVMDKQKEKALLSDGSVLIYLENGNAGKQELTYYNDNPQGIATELKADGVEVTGKGSFDIKTPEGYIINIVQTDKQIQKPAGKSLITMAPSDSGNESKYPNPRCGAFGEYSLPVADLAKSIAFWEKLGYKSAMKEMAPYPHAILTDGVFIIGLHQTNQFSKPGPTYFSTNMAERINKLKSEGLQDGIAIDANNEVFKAPDGQAVFLFSL